MRIWLAPKKASAIFIEYGEGSGGKWSAKAWFDPRDLLPYGGELPRGGDVVCTSEPRFLGISKTIEDL